MGGHNLDIGGVGRAVARMMGIEKEILAAIGECHIENHLGYRKEQKIRVKTNP
jgi:hypothetical protein